MAIEKAYIVPHPPLIVSEVGKGDEKRIQDTLDAYEKISREIAKIKPETIVIITPHSVMYGDYIHISPGKSASGDFSRFGAPQLSIKKEYDTQFVDELSFEANSAGISAGTLGQKDSAIDHGALVPLYFLDKHEADYKIVRVSISGLSFLEHYKFGQCIAKAADILKRKTVIIASGDLSHKLTDGGPYSYAPQGPEFDKKVTDAMKTGDFMQFLNFDEDFCEAAGECGLRSFIEMAGALDGKSVTPEFFSYEGPFGVGYAVCGFDIGGKDESRQLARIYQQELAQRLEDIKTGEDEYVKLARMSLETYVKTGRQLDMPKNLSDDLVKNKAGVFVSLKKDGRLRGCIGTIEPAKSSIAQEIITNAVSAGTGDPRFDVVTKQELGSLVYSVDVLGNAEPIDSIDELDVIKYGVIVTKGYRRGLLLPNLDGVDTPEKQVSIALRKAGINENEKYTMERFRVVRHK